MNISGAISRSSEAGKKSKQPLYAQLASALRGEIVGGVFPVGSLLPTEDKLAERFSVSRYTVREALRQLREDGLVSSRRGAGTIVVSPGATASDIHQVMSINDLVAFATDTRFAIEIVRMVTISKKLAWRTGLASGEEWLVVHGYRYPDELTVPVCAAEYYIHRDYAAVGRILQRHTGPIFPLIEDMFGLSIVEVHQQISATFIPTKLAADFEIAEESAALEVRRSYKTDAGKIVQVTINTHPADRFQHSMTMRRVKP
ncbi:MAG: GntR family transcriptional regulator [Halieaceae bacterium]|jgi:GntR family transcriptional regulator